MKVYLVFQGEDYEGGHEMALFFTKEEAAMFINEYMKNHPSDRWKFDEKYKTWRSGCTYLEIRSKEIHQKWRDAAFWLKDDDEAKGSRNVKKRKVEVDEEKENEEEKEGKEK